MFDGPVPPPRELYWRGLVYSNFFQGTWSVGGMSSAPENMPVTPGSHSDFIPDHSGRTALSYQVLMEPTEASWLFALDVAMPVARGTALTRDFRLITDEPIHTMFRYRAQAYPDVATDLELPDWLRRRETQLPEGDNPRIIAFAKRLAAHSDGPEAFLDNVLHYIRTEAFFYTLNPPTAA